jgi:hypothetical protein
MGAVIDLAQKRRQWERQVHRADELPAAVVKAIQAAEMDPRHEHLNASLDDAPELKP